MNLRLCDELVGGAFAAHDDHRVGAGAFDHRHQVVDGRKGEVCFSAREVGPQRVRGCHLHELHVEAARGKPPLGLRRHDRRGPIQANDGECLHGGLGEKAGGEAKDRGQRDHETPRHRDTGNYLEMWPRCLCVSVFRGGHVCLILRWSLLLDIHLIDGTYELFRHYYALPSAKDRDGREVAAVRGVLASVLAMIKGGARHLGVATDHVIESFRNGLWPGYKTSAGIEPDLLAQFPLLEEALSALGVVVWPMVEFEADDALAAAAAKAALDPRVERVIICTPDKDLAQCVRGMRVVQMNRRHASSSTKPASSRSSECLRHRFPIIWLWWVMPRMVIRACGLGSQVHGGGARAIRPSRIHSRGLAHLGRQRRQPWVARAHAGPRARPRLPLSGSRHAAHRPAAVRFGRRPATGTVRRPHSKRSPRGSIPPSLR